ncbi:MAG: hypothetical protein ACJA2S_003143 [Cyclobacteriaceae bacterium]
MRLFWICNPEPSGMRIYNPKKRRSVLCLLSSLSKKNQPFPTILSKQGSYKQRSKQRIMKTIYIALLSIILSSCTDDHPLSEIHRHFTNDSNLFTEIVNGDSQGDPFTIFSIKRSTNALEIKLGYSGGCADHDFELVWNGSYDTFKERPITSLALVHNGNGDMCEAYVTETLIFNLSDIFEDEATESSYDLLFYHGFNKDEYFMADETMNITQGIECNLNASFEEVMCGSGFFNNRWFRSTGDGLINGYDTFYFQPVDYDLDDTPQLGSYELSVRIMKEYIPETNQVICLAYPGYSIPVKITCLNLSELD